ncbi:MAG: hypothetical protein V4556_00005, partial [Bacteroidota bacterium]
AGVYSVTVTLANGCSATNSATLVVNDPPTVNVTAPARCSNGDASTISVTPAGAANYAWTVPTGVTNPGNVSSFSATAAGVYSVTVTLANGCSASGSATLIINTPECTLTAPQTLPNCGSTGNTLTVPAGFANYDWTVTGNGMYVSGDGTNTLTYDLGNGGDINISLTVTDGAGCTATCNVTFTCILTGKACTPGFWKTHSSVWDTQADFTVNNMPGTLTSPVTAGGTFVDNTSFWEYFNIPQGTCGLPNTPLTMIQATALGGGDCIALARHAVSALLGAAAFPDEYPYPAGASNYTQLYNMIRNAFLTCDCSSLHTTLAAINELDGEFCGALDRLPQGRLANVYTQVSPAIVEATANKLTLSAYPNPYRDVINFRILSPKSGKALLEIYDVLGRKLATVYNGNVTAAIPMDVKYNVTSLTRGTLIYKLWVDSKIVHGSLLSGKQ